MQIIFLGTASCYPTQLRGVSCTALRLEDGDVWLFDCGEGSQVQLQKSILKPGRIMKIFITHLHGDHLFGLPGLICTLGNQVLERKSFVLEIFGPHGIRKYVRQILNLSRSPLPFSYVVHELIPVEEQFPADWRDWQVEHEAKEPCHPQELLGRNICAGDDLTWDVFEDARVQVRAGAVLHRVPTFGFVVQESDQPGHLDSLALERLGLAPGPVYGRLKKGEVVALPDGTVIDPSEVLGPPKRGRKVTILGDTHDPSRMKALARDSDVVLHEATLEDALQEKAIQNGHSTPSMAAQFACSVGARKLVLYHFSQRYAPAGCNDDDDDDDAAKKGSTVSALLKEAETALSDCKTCDVIAAEDFMDIAVTRPPYCN